MANKAVSCGIDEFVKAFFPAVSSKTSSKPSIEVNPFQSLKSAGSLSEKKISKEFTSAINVHNLVPGYKLALSEDRPYYQAVDSTRQRVDSAFFPADKTPDDGRPHWPDQIIPVEFKNANAENDPYDDTPDDVLPATARTRTKVRGQLITYAELAFAVQQRTALFTFLVLGRRLRLIRWDRSGCIVTKAVDYYVQWKKVCDILWRISRMSRSQLGFDSTATRIYEDDEDWDLMDRLSKPNAGDWDHSERILLDDKIPEKLIFAYVRAKFQESLVKGWPRYILRVPDGTSGKMREFLVGKPSFLAQGMAGRGTQGYVALERDTGIFSWLKNAWRAAYLDVDQEGVTLSKLVGVPNVPTLVCHGDIEGHRTITADWWIRKHPPQSSVVPAAPARDGPPAASSSRVTLDRTTSAGTKRKRGVVVEDDGVVDQSKFRRDCPLRLHQHYRLVVAEVAMPLSEIRGGRQLVKIIYDCLYAHYVAMDQKHIIHRDVSGGNILIMPKIVCNPTTGANFLTWSGLLADWEMSKPTTTHEKISLPRQPERTGTWQFMSVDLLSRSTKMVSTVDELEAFFYVILYYAIRYLRSNCPDVPNWIEDFFDSYSVQNGEYFCGATKAYLMKNHGGILALQPGSKGQRLRFSSPLDNLLTKLIERFRAYYIVEAEKELELEAAAERAKEIAALKTSVNNLPLPPAPHGDSGVGFFGSEELEKEIGDVISDDMQPQRRATERDRELAKLIQSHKTMLVLLSQTGKQPLWPQNDLVGDQVPASWRPKRPVGPLGRSIVTACDDTNDEPVDSDDEAGPGRSSNKRRRMKAVAEDPGPPVFSSLPAVVVESQMPTKEKQTKVNEKQLRRAGLRPTTLAQRIGSACLKAFKNKRTKK